MFEQQPPPSLGLTLLCLIPNKGARMVIFFIPLVLAGHSLCTRMWVCGCGYKGCFTGKWTSGSVNGSKSESPPNKCFAHYVHPFGGVHTAT